MTSRYILVFMIAISRIREKAFDYWNRHGFKSDFQPNAVYLTTNDYKELLTLCNYPLSSQGKEWIGGLRILSTNSEVTSVGRFNRKK